MTELPEELKKEQVCCNTSGFHPCKGGTNMCVYAIPSLVVASFLEKKKKEQEEILNERIEGFRKVRKGVIGNSKVTTAYDCFIGHLVELKRALPAVLGGEEK